MFEKFISLFLITLCLLNDIDSQYNEVLYLPLQDNNLPISSGYECDKRVSQDPDFKKCRETAYETWYTNDDNKRTKYSCCYNWDIFECMEKTMAEVCYLKSSSMDYRSFIMKRDEWVNYYESFQCNDYKFRSVKCHFPGWAIALIVIGCLIIIGIIVGAVFMARRNRFRRHRK